LLTELLHHAESRVALRGPDRWVPRLRHYAGTAKPALRTGDDHAVRLESVQPGGFDGLALQQLARAPLQPHEVRLRVLSAGINFRDVLTVLQMYPGPPPPAGRRVRGDRHRSRQRRRSFPRRRPRVRVRPG
jgi:polyketide synthase 12